MKRFASRRGSALLVVLGMMAFIVISAVAFSAYMRYSRLPSSYLRRTSSSRLLVKAALAEAINTVDLAIGNNPYPGVGGNTYNHFLGRVFTGSNGVASTSATVATLSMEGLAYIPPAFINEVRYYSRRTPTAGWQTLNYDAGRYAYCAVDVSDCFDVNRLLADIGRDSSDEGRITLSYCFENGEHTDYGKVKPSAWDTFMEKFTNEGGSGSKIPLVSVADLNLALNSNGGFTEMTPFCKYLKQTSDAKMVEDDTEGSQTVELQRHLNFVTDSYFPVTNVVSTDVIDLSRAKDQPFYGMRVMKNEDLKKNDDTLDTLFESANSQYKNYLDFPRLVQLYDYLDGDSVPLSLSLPTAERVPMVTSVGFNSTLTLNVEKKTPKEITLAKDTTGKATRTARVTVADLKISGELGVKVGTVFPFKYSHGTTPTFKAQVAATVTLVPSGSEQNLRRSKAVTPAVIEKNDWATSKKSAESKSYAGEQSPSVITMMSAPQNIKVKNEILEEEDAVCDDLTFDFETFDVSFASEFENSSALKGAQIDDSLKKGAFRKIEILQDEEVESSSFETALRPSNEEMSASVKMQEGTKYVPVVQVWVRILDTNNKVVDLVPACVKDDEQETDILSEFRSTRERPVLRFYSSNAEGAAITADESVLDLGQKEVTLTPKVYMADDPRFNHAPECLVAQSTFEGEFKTAWLDKQRSSKRDGDIFMMTSDAGYLQSVFEMAALLDTEREDLDDGIDGKIRTAFDDTLAAGEAMWRTWSQCKLGDSDGNDITRAVKFVERGRGFRVNPYTSDVNVMMGALANTPIDWWAAGTNDHCAAASEKGKMLDSLSEANKYTFSSHKGALVEVKYGKRSNPTGTLTELAQKLMSTIRGSSNWETAFDTQVDWNSEDKIAGVDLGVTLHSVDKKFLHGFWRGCFANKQHLFLIFVRAEPMMMGGGGMGQTPPQLGARAVALVWRDPTPNVKYPNGPHRTRVLFYRQFE